MTAPKYLRPCKPLYYADCTKNSRLIVYFDSRLKDNFKRECNKRGFTMNEVITSFVTRWTMKKYRQSRGLTAEDTRLYKKMRHEDHKKAFLGGY